ncbi:TPA: restriction endonuclease subunit S [Streptococcus suis]|nr:restriction endonuclease subunit S [Streptococcus suis]
MPNKERNIPKRRFKEFENADAWELRKIFEIADRFDNLRVPIASSLRVSGSTPYYGANGIQDYVEGYTHEGEFILVAEDGANDLKNYPVNLVNGKIWVNNHAHVLQGKKSIADNKFLAFSINQTNIESLLVGGGRAKLNSDVLMNIELKLPSPAEQEAIGTFFSTLDQHITLHQRKLDKLKSVKQAYLSEMFPAEGERVPKRRFPGFTDAWELRKLVNEVLFIGTGKSKFSVLEFGEFEILGSTSVIGYDNSYDYEGDFILTARVGANAGELYRHSGKVKISDNTVFIQGDLLDFIFYILQHFDIKKLSFGTGQPLVKASELKGLKIIMPVSVKERNHVGTFFSTLDRHITLHQRKLEKLKNLKKALLNELFV